MSQTMSQPNEYDSIDEIDELDELEQQEMLEFKKRNEAETKKTSYNYKIYFIWLC